jgi:hypothetical protein
VGLQPEQRQKWIQHGTTLVNTGSARCLDIPGGTMANNTQVEIWDCHSDTNQQWTLPST